MSSSLIFSQKFDNKWMGFMYRATGPKRRGLCSATMEKVFNFPLSICRDETFTFELKVYKTNPKKKNTIKVVNYRGGVIYINNVQHYLTRDSWEDLYKDMPAEFYVRCVY